MRKNKKRYARTEVVVPDRHARVTELIQRLAETQSTIADLLSDEVNFVLDPSGGGTPALLRQAQEALGVIRGKLETRLSKRSASLVATDMVYRVDSAERAASVKATDESRDCFRTLVELAPEAIAVHRRGSWVYMNPAGIRLLGADHPSEIIGRPVLDFVHPEDRPSVEEEVRRLEAVEKPTSPSPSRMLRLDRQVVHVEWRVIPASYEGEPAVLVVIRDVAEDAILRLASFPEMNPNPVLETDEVGHIHYANPTALRVSPNLRDAGLEHPWLGDLQRIFETFRRDGRTILTREVKLGSAWYLQWLHHIPERRRLRSYLFEITERKLAEEALRNARDALERQLAEGRWK